MLCFILHTYSCYRMGDIINTYRILTEIPKLMCHLADVGVDRNITFKWNLKKVGRVQARWSPLSGVLNTVINTWFHKRSGIFPLAERLLNFMKDPFSMELVILLLSNKHFRFKMVFFRSHFVGIVGQFCPF